MDGLRQSASTAVGQRLGPSTEEGPAAALSRTWTGHVKGALPTVTPIEVYAESNSTTSSSSVVSSGRSSPVSTSTATSNFYFYLEDEEELATDGEAASQLIRNFNSAFHKDFRGRRPLKRGLSHGADKTATTRSNSTSDEGLGPEPSLPSGERSPMHPHYTFPIRSAYGWSALNSPTHPASAPVSAPESRRGSTQTGRPKSMLSVTEPMYSDYCVGTSDEPDQISDILVTDKPESSDTPQQGLQDGAGPSQADGSEKGDESAMPSRQRRDQRQIEDICEAVLREAFNVDLQDLTFAGDALESVAHCLEELSSVVYSDRSLELAAPFRTVPSGDRSFPRSEEHGGGDDHRQAAQKSRGKRRASSRNDRNGDGWGAGEDQDDAHSGGEDKGSSPAPSKKIRVEPPDNHYPCPYRKRNPLKFNVRDYNTCATASFSDFTNLKRHIKLYHRRQARLPYVCFRCGIDQGTRDQMMAHVQLPPDRICAVRQEVQTSDPEEGITQEVEDVLNERKSKAKIDTWPSLWQALFGCDDDILPSDFEPPVEWDEVKAEFEGTRDILKNRVQLESVTIKELRPEAQSYVAAHMDHTCWDYINSVLSTSRLQVDYQSEKHHKRRRSQRSNVAIRTSAGDGLLPPVMQRHILPKPTSGISEDGMPVGPNSAAIVSNGSSLSSSWETAISNVSSSNLLSTSSSTSLITQGEPQLPNQQKLPFICLPGNAASHTGIPLADMVCGTDVSGSACQDQGTDLVFHDATAIGGFPAYIDTMDEGEFALEDGLECLFGYDADY
jgi:hypothetical protein